MTVIGIRFLTTMALVAATTVALALLIALPLIPALLGLIGERTWSRKARAAPDTRPARAGRTSRADGVELLVRYPWFAVASVVVVLGLATPAPGMDLGLPTGGTAPHDKHVTTKLRRDHPRLRRGRQRPAPVVAHPEDGGTLDQAALGEIAAGLNVPDEVASASLMGADPDTPWPCSPSSRHGAPTTTAPPPWSKPPETLRTRSPPRPRPRSG